METDQIHSYINKHDSSSSTRIFGLDKQNAKVYSVLSKEIRALDKKLDNYYSKYNSLKKLVKRLERSVEFLVTELEDLDECVDRETVVDLIHEIALSPNIKKYKNSSYSSESFEESDLVETVVVKKRNALPPKQQRKACQKRLKKVISTGSNRFSSTSHVSMGYYSEYTDEYKTYWVEFTALFNNRRKKEGCSPTQLYNILLIEIGLSASTLASFYRHQKSPRKTSIDKIIEWVEKEGNKKV
ncbi:36728_t:CDS:2, partial [Gigaspora margarita]